VRKPAKNTQPMRSQPHPTAANFEKNWSTESKKDVARTSGGGIPAAT